MNTVPNYNAFISYRHHPQDIAVAEAIHKGLERFKVPSSLKKQGKKIDRIFRDKEELPITSSLTDTITTALRNSDYQIVICSTHLKDSYWVLREIEAFLQTHTKDQILTVIVDGEPQDVIPEILTYREVTDPVTGATVREPLEPLSCDWRMPKRKAMKTELPRLAAVLLGCTYNDLIQRQKQYQMQRMLMGGSVALAISLGFAGYFLYSSIRIQENLDQSLRNQSHYLASTSQALYEEGDRLSAIALALEALPTEENPRPYVIEAERALSEALLLYQPGETFIATSAFTADQNVESFTLSPDGSILYTQDSHYNVIAWDTATASRLGSFPLNMLHYKLHTDAKGNLVVDDGEGLQTLQCYAPDGTLLWQQEKVNTFTFTQDRSLIIANTSGMSESVQVMVIDPETGKLLRSPTPLESGTFYMSSGGFSGYAYYTDHLWPIALTTSNKGTVHYISMAYNHADGSFTTLIDSPQQIIAQTVTPDGSILVAVNATEYTGSDLPDWQENFIDLHCFRPNGTPLWTTRLTGYRTGRIQTLEPIPDSGHLMVQCDNGLYVLSSDSGTILARYIAAELPLAVKPGAAGATVIFRNGSMTWFDYATGGIHQTAYQLDTDLEAAQINHGIYTSKNLSPTILRYTSTADSSYQVVDPMDGVYLNEHTDDVLASDTHMALIAKDTLRCCDLTSGTTLWVKPWPQGKGNLLGFSTADNALYAYDEQQVLRYDIDDGSSSALEFPTRFWAYSNFTLADDHLLYIDMSRYKDDCLWLIDWDLQKNTYTEHKIPASHLPREAAAVCYADSTQVLVQGDNGTVCHITRADGTCRILARDVPSSPAILTDPDSGTITLALDGELQVTDHELNRLQTIPLPDISAVSLFRMDTRLLVLGSDGQLYVFAEDGSLEKQYPMAVYDSFYHASNARHRAISTSWAVTENGEVVINIFGVGNILSLEENLPRYHLKNLLHYDPATGKLYCYADIDYTLLTYDLLSTEEVIARGKETLGSFTLTDDQKQSYGLN